jgi:hypothetical protein
MGVAALRVTIASRKVDRQPSADFDPFVLGACGPWPSRQPFLKAGRAETGGPCSRPEEGSGPHPNPRFPACDGPPRSLPRG